MIRDVQTPGIARATAVASIAPYLDRRNADVLQIGLADEDPMLRAATLSALESVPLGLQVRLAWPLLIDPVRAARIEAARSSDWNGDITTHYSAPELEELIEAANRVCEQKSGTGYSEAENEKPPDRLTC